LIEGSKKKDKKRKSFNQTTILAHFNARCEECIKKGIITPTNLTTHHKNGDRSDDSLKNLEILCLTCHRRREGILHKKKDDR